MAACYALHGPFRLGSLLRTHHGLHVKPNTPIPTHTQEAVLNVGPASVAGRSTAATADRNRHRHAGSAGGAGHGAVRGGAATNAPVRGGVLGRTTGGGGGGGAGAPGAAGAGRHAAARNAAALAAVAGMTGGTGRVGGADGHSVVTATEARSVGTTVATNLEGEWLVGGCLATGCLVPLPLCMQDRPICACFLNGMGCLCHP